MNALIYGREGRRSVEQLEGCEKKGEKKKGEKKRKAEVVAEVAPRFLSTMTVGCACGLSNFVFWGARRVCKLEIPPFPSSNLIN